MFNVRKSFNLSEDVLHNIAKKNNKKNSLTQKREIKVTENAKTSRKIGKFKCREIYKSQNREINVSRKFHVIR